MKKIDYFWTRALFNITGIILIVQVVTEVLGIVKRKPGYEWVLGASVAAFLLSLAISLAVILWNSYVEYKK